MGRTTATRTILAGAGLLAVLLTTACNGGQSGASGTATSNTASATPTTLVVPPPSITPTTSPAAVPAGTGMGAGNGGPARPADCQAAALLLGLGGSSAAAGHVFQSLQFTNTGSVPCVIAGFPGVSYVTGDNGQQVGQPAVRDGAMGGPITLAPGQTASAVISMTNIGVFDPNACQPTAVRGLRIYAPNDTAAMFVARTGTGCAGNPPDPQLRVQTVKPGAGGP